MKKQVFTDGLSLHHEVWSWNAGQGLQRMQFSMLLSPPPARRTCTCRNNAPIQTQQQASSGMVAARTLPFWQLHARTPNQLQEE